MNRSLKYILFGFLFLVPLLAFAQVDVNLPEPTGHVDSQSLEWEIFKGGLAAVAPFVVVAVFMYILSRLVVSNFTKVILLLLIGLSLAAPYIISTQNIGMCIDYYTKNEAFKCGVRFMFNQRNPLVYVALGIATLFFIRSALLLFKKPNHE